jgi:hypothetical protein
MFLLFAFFALAAIAGCLFLCWIMGNGRPLPRRIDSLLFSFPLGASLITLALFTLNQGLGIAINRRSIFLASGVMAVLLAMAFRLRKKRNLPYPPGTDGTADVDAPSFYQRLCFVSIMAALVIFFTYKIMAPVYFWDAWSYHLPIAERIFADGKLPGDIGLGSQELSNAYPAFIPILYGIENVLFGRPHYWFIKIISFAFAWLGCFLVYRISQLVFARDRGSALGAVIICLSMEMFLFYSVFASNTIVMSFFCLGAVYFYAHYLIGADDRWLYLIGVSLGFAYWVEYSGALFAAVFLLALLVTHTPPSRRKGAVLPRMGVRGFMKICLPAFCVVLPHLGRNLLFFGNPVYPALAGTLGGKNIDAWAMQHSTNLPGLQGLALWFDVLHWGFLAPLFFLLYLFRRKWWKSPLELFVITLCFAYYVAYLLFLRYPPTVGDSSKFLLPILCLAAALGGSAMKDMFTKGLRLSESLALVALLMAWQIVTCRNELLLDTERYWPVINPASWKAWLTFFNGVIFDFHQSGLIAVVILCYVLNAARVSTWIKKGLMAAGMAVLMGQVFQQIAFPLVWHLERAYKDPNYRYVEYINPRWLQPEGEWMEKNLPKDAALLSFDSRFYIIPRRVVPADSYRLKEMYQAQSVDEALRVLKTHGVTHVHLDETAYGHPLYRELPFLHSLGDRRRFSLVYEHAGRIQGPGNASGIKIYELR